MEKDLKEKLEFYNKLKVLQKKIDTQFNNMTKKQKNELIHFLVVSNKKLDISVPLRFYLIENSDGIKEYCYVTLKGNKVKLSKSNVLKELSILKRELKNNYSIKNEMPYEEQCSKIYSIINAITTTTQYPIKTILQELPNHVYSEKEFIYRGLSFEDKNKEEMFVGNKIKDHFSFTTDLDTAKGFAEMYKETNCFFNGTTYILKTKNVPVFDIEKSYDFIKESDFYKQKVQSSLDYIEEMVYSEKEHILLKREMTITKISRVEKDVYLVDII